jgi:CheY-like chemotaxis protein
MKSDSLLIPCCYFPTRIVMVDDNERLTTSLKPLLESELEIFNDPQYALTYLSSYIPAVTEHYWLQPENEFDLGDNTFIQPMMIDTGEIRSLQHDPDKYHDISVVIMDYHMPEMNGLELLSKLSQKPFKTILLTGEGDHTLAVKAFNEGHIDYFLRKDEDNLADKLNHLIKKLQLEYFKELTKKTREILALDNPLYSDKKIGEYFYDLFNQNNIKEFYLINLWGNYLLINQQRQRQYFCAYTQEQLNSLADNALGENVSPDVIHNLMLGNQIPFFGENTPYWKIKGENWGDFMFNSKVIQTNHGNIFVGMK